MPGFCTPVKFLGKSSTNYSRGTFPHVALAGVPLSVLASSFVNATPTHRLADLLLPTTLADFVQTRRDVGRSWRLIARDLHEETDGQVDVTAETLRSWFGTPERVPA